MYLVTESGERVRIHSKSEFFIDAQGEVAKLYLKRSASWQLIKTCFDNEAAEFALWQIQAAFNRGDKVYKVEV